MRREGEWRIPSGCGLSGFINRDGCRESGERIIRSIAVLNERSNGLGGGFAAYGIYPEYKDCYALHIIFEDEHSRRQTEEFLRKHFRIEAEGPIPTRRLRSIGRPPGLGRYFVVPRVPEDEETSEEDLVVRLVMQINAGIPGAYVISSGKNMGAFKGVGYPEDIGEFFRLDEYAAYTWIAHGRFPTNTPGWWGGAHPFTLLDWAVVHNGEISSYGANRRFLEMYGYEFTLQTDTEVVAYAIDFLVRRHGLPLEVAAKVLAPPFWEEIDHLPPQERAFLRDLRAIYGSLLLNGPFAIIVGFSRGMLALNDRIKLRPLVAGEKGATLYVASEEAAIREICPDLERVWYPEGGEPVVGELEEECVYAAS